MQEEMLNTGVFYPVMDYINDHIEENIKISDIAKKVHYQDQYLMRKFKSEANSTITDEINNLRILSSIDELVYTDKSLLNIALNCGYNSGEYYSEVFKKRIGISPNNYRKLIYASLDKDELSEEQFNLLNKKINDIDIILNHMSENKDKYESIKYGNKESLKRLLD